MILQDDTNLKATVVGRDTKTDLALLKVDFASNHVASLRAGVRVGEEIAAFGYPLQGTLSAGGNFNGTGKSVAAQLWAI